MNKPDAPAQPALEFPGCTVKIVRAFKPGDVIFLETARPLPREAMQHISAEFKRFLPDLRVVILRDGVKVVGREEAAPWIELVLQWRALLDGVAVDSPAFEAAKQMDEVLRDLRAGGST